MRTLVISDLHLGNRAGHDVLRQAGPRAKLLDALDDIDRLVLLGDTLELLTRHPRRSMVIAEPVLRAIGRRLGRDRELIFVPGNHDAPLVRDWVRAQGGALAPDCTVDPSATPALRRVVSWLEPATVRVHYPGAWLAEGVWATHGHYLDKHLLPESAFGLPRGRLRDRPSRRSPAVEYERGRRRGSRSRREPLPARMLSRPLATLLESSSEVLRAATMPSLPRLLMQARLTPLTATLIDAQMRHASIPAVAQVAQRLDVQADWLVFGHVHRRGPLADESWPPWGDGTQFLNTGSWLYEPLLVDRATPPHPYWPGGAVLLESGLEPRSLGLLDGLDAGELRAAGR